MRGGRSGERRREPREIAQQQGAGRAKLQHQRRVGDILAGGPEMHVAGGRGVDGGDEPSELFHERDGEGASARRLRGELIDVDRGRLHGLSDRSSSLLRNDAAFGLGAGERGLEGEGVGDQAVVLEDGQHLRRRDHARL